MPYKDAASQAAYHAAWYSENRSRCNPGRKRAREVAYAVRAELVILSHVRWIHPMEIGEMLDRRLGPVAPGIKAEAMRVCVRLFPEALNTGLLHGEPTFTRILDGPVYAEFCERMPKRVRADGSSELLILELRLKRITKYGYMKCFY